MLMNIIINNEWSFPPLGIAFMWQQLNSFTATLSCLKCSLPVDYLLQITLFLRVNRRCLASQFSEWILLLPLFFQVVFLFSGFTCVLFPLPNFTVEPIILYLFLKNIFVESRSYFLISYTKLFISDSEFLGCFLLILETIA